MSNSQTCDINTCAGVVEKDFFFQIRLKFSRVFPPPYTKHSPDPAQSSSGLSPRTYSRLRTILLRCNIFDSDSGLRAIFVDRRIKPWRDVLPAASNRQERVVVVIDFLYGNHNSTRENALVLFLRVLSDQIDPSDGCHQDLIELANELEHASKNPVNITDLTQLRTDYLTYLCERYQYLDIRGLPQLQQVTQQLPLEGIYVSLNAYATASTHIVHRVAGRDWQQIERIETNFISSKSPDSEHNVVSEARVAVEEIPVNYPAVVILGDPGAGKSTLLKVLALAWAKQQGEGPLPIIVSLNAYASRLQQGQISLADYLAEYFASRSPKLANIADLFYTALDDQRALILLDGLDEVRTDRAYLVDLIGDFVREYIPLSISDKEKERITSQVPIPGNRIVVTSRIVGYKDMPLPSRQWRTYALNDFEKEDIEQFVCKWTLALVRTIKGDTETSRQDAEIERQVLLNAISARPSIKRLATNPLLLTILALIKYSGAALPNERVKLYELYLETLIESWHRARSLDRRSVGPEIDYQDTVQILAPMALWLKQRNPTYGLISRNELEKWLVQYFRSEEWGYSRGEARKQGRRFLREIETSSNLLVERGEDQYGFLYLTLEEMLAAQGIVYLMDEDFSVGFEMFRENLLDPVWRETLLLTIGFIGVVRRNRKLSGTILQGLLHIELLPEFANRQVVFAGEALLDMGKTKVSRPIAEEIILALINTVEASESHILTRSNAGSVLGHLGDPRKGILTLPLLLTDVIEGEFKYGAYRKKECVKAFRAGVYPVTNAQFAAFIQADGYEHDEWWNEAGWLWRHRISRYRKQRLNQPDYWHGTVFNNPNQPVVGITWYEADAFCRWLSIVYTGKYRLPTEREWESIARGKEGNEYPWGNEWIENIANTAESEIGRTSAVGIFHEGVSPTGAYDCAGNVWEWCDDWYDVRQRRKILRGGAWNYDKDDARCWSRSGDLPHGSLNNVGFRVIMELK